MAKKYSIKNFLSFKNILILLCVVGGLAYLWFEWGPQLMAFFSNTEHIKQLIRSAGPLGWVIYLVLQVFQTVFAPIPGNVVGMVGGMAFGEWMGFLLTVVGSALGMALVIAISRRFGRPLLEKLFSKSKVKKLDWLLDHSAVEMVLFLIFLFPFMPDDLVGYLAGLTKIRFRNLMIISVVGKAPTQLLTILFGSELMRGDWSMALIILGVVALVALVIFLNRRLLMGFVQADNHWQYLKSSLKRQNKVQSNHVSNDSPKTTRKTSR
jgi:uncharacterized membrane protein YdjX (TVP38/TMEM64 family)